MPYKKCSNCQGLGTIPDYLNQGYTRSAGMGRNVCPSCNGNGKKYVHESQLPNGGRPSGDAVSGDFNPFVWFYAPLGALFGGFSTPWDLWWPIAAFLGFVVFGFFAGLISRFRYGRYALSIFALLFIGAVILTIWLGDSSGT